MKYILLAMLLCSFSVTAQKKPVKKDPPPSQKEMNEMMKEMEEAFNNMSPEEKKFMDSMGIKMPNAKQMKKTADFAMANSSVQPDVLVPKRDAIRIAAISKIPLTKAALPAYLQSVYQNLVSKFPSSIISKTDELYKAVKSKYGSSTAVANAAVGCWAFGKAAPALLLLGRACSEDPTNSNHLNNFAAILSMCGGEQLSLPLLNYLNQQHPQNSTILNNIAHAWFGLGDVTTASKYIDSTIRLCAWHPQANQIKAAIAESKGNKTEAIKALKQSISRMHTPDKERALNNLGYELKSDDIIWGPRNAPDQLGLSKFAWPSFPKSVTESEDAEIFWKAIRSEFDARMAALQAEHEILLNNYNQAFQARMKHDMNAPQTGATTSAMFGNVVPKAVIKLRPYVDALLEQEAKDPLGLAVVSLKDTLRSYEETYVKRLQEINKNMKPGEEGSGINEAYCEAVDAAATEFLKSANSLIEALCIKHRDRAKKRITELVNLKLYSEFPEKFALTVNEAKMEWLSLMMMPKDLIYFKDPNRMCTKKQEKTRGRFALAAYDDVNCLYRSKSDFVFGSIETICGRTVAKIEIDFVKIGWETKSADLEANRNFMDEFQRCTIEVTAGVGRSIGEGPLQLQTSVGATGFLEFDRTGLTDAGVKIEANVSVGTNVLDTKVETEIGEVNVGPGEPSVSLGGVNATISISSGFTATGSGILKGVKL
jgi:hypothetical protein